MMTLDRCVAYALRHTLFTFLLHTGSHTKQRIVGTLHNGGSHVPYRFF